jgi:hypothetical protein
MHSSLWIGSFDWSVSLGSRSLIKGIDWTEPPKFFIVLMEEVDCKIFLHEAKPLQYFSAISSNKMHI